MTYQPILSKHFTPFEVVHNRSIEFADRCQLLVLLQHANLQLHVSHTWIKSGCLLIKQLMGLMGIINVENGGSNGGTLG